ncbi:unnamed protein product [Mytilus coruscus]|uniref:Uncharacterized protein n=1 Tax=Mytilus coruscus TaxID=42192 RepID=A0A6J8EDM5_MYTCO|nr:unnamed protein product [Mytilus coruscus]
MTGNTTSTECESPKGNYLFRDPVMQNVTGVAVSLMSVIVYLKWSSVCIVHDNKTDYQATLLHQMLSAAGIFGNVQRMEHMTSQRIDALMLEKTAANDDTSLNCTLLCSLNACQNYLAKPFEYGRKHVVRSSLIHNSRWLLGIFHNGDLSVLETNCSTVLDNVAVIQFPTSFQNKPQHHADSVTFQNKPQYHADTVTFQNKPQHHADTVTFQNKPHHADTVTFQNKPQHHADTVT